jgi:hypothetical protein
MAMWRKGQSGNLSGRPKAVLDLRDLARQHPEAAVKTLRDRKTSPAARVAAARPSRPRRRPQHVPCHIGDPTDAKLIAIATGSGKPAADAENDPDEPDRAY